MAKLGLSGKSTMNSPETHVVSMCHVDHKDVWKLTSRLLPLFVPADLYTVYVPQDQLALFKQITGPEIKVLSEADLHAEFAGALRELLVEAGNESRYGWYLQQLCKFEALRQSNAPRRIIWDADCVPTRPIQLFYPDGRPNFMRAEEFHGDYFELVEKWLGLSRVQSQSFITPGFPILGDWVDEFFRFVKRKHQGQSWHDSLFSNINFSLGAGFSEFETLGTWVANFYPNQYRTSRYEWERYGQSRFGLAAAFTPEDVQKIGLLHDLDIVSFENWDKPDWKRKMRNFLSRRDSLVKT